MKIKVRAPSHDLNIAVIMLQVSQENVLSVLDY